MRVDVDNVETFFAQQCVVCRASSCCVRVLAAILLLPC